VQTHKLLFLREYFKKKGADIVKEKAFEEYVFQNEWVENYALFKVLKDIMSKYHWQTWPSDLQFLDEKRRDELISTNWVEVCFYVFLQYLCYKQLKEVRAYANERGVFLKGDIPILLSPDSADVWEYTDEFDLTLSAGAPPDRFTPNGQFWGLPIFRWNVMESRDFDWWKNRLDYAANFYDIYRIDHIIGFFRIWAIPHGQPARVGKFIPDDQSHWLEHGKNILTTLVARSPMLPIGEDLGVVPDTVRACLSSLGICGTKVIRWEEKHEPKDYDPISMTTVSTHDSETLLQWWQEDHKEPLSKEKRKELLETCHNSASLFHINLIGEYLALFPELVWENPQDERINVPGTVSPNNWTYRIRPSVEEILAHKPLAEEVKSLLC
jgi:4-alpha-glucanotransferase